MNEIRAIPYGLNLKYNYVVWKVWPPDFDKLLKKLYTPIFINTLSNKSWRYEGLVESAVKRKHKSKGE